MYHKEPKMFKKSYAVVLLLLLIITPLAGSTAIEQILKEAKAFSPIVKRLEIAREQAELAEQLNDVEKELSLSVAGSVGILQSKMLGTLTDEWFISTNAGAPTVTMVFPNEEGTVLKLSTGTISKSLESAAWAVGPSITVDHTFSFGQKKTIQETLDDLNYAKGTLETDETYLKGIINFENSVYRKMIELLNQEKSILSTTAQIEIKKRDMANNLALRKITQTAMAYQESELALARLESTLAGYNRKYEMLKVQYEQMTGQSWTEIILPSEVDLVVHPREIGNNGVALAAIDVEIARYALDLKKQEEDLKLKVGSTAAVSTSNTSTSYKLSGQGNLTGTNFTAGASFDLGISNAGKITPSFSLSGSWSNTITQETDRIELTRLENTLNLAMMNQSDKILQYQESVNTLQNNIISHQLEREEFERSTAYNQRLLEQAEDRLARGLGVQSDVDNALLNLELDTFQNKILRLNALILANEIRLLNL